MGHTAQDILVATVDDWRQALDEGKVVGSVTLDLSMAFDTISLIITGTCIYSNPLVHSIRSLFLKKKTGFHCFPDISGVLSDNGRLSLYCSGNACTLLHTAVMAL